MNKKSKKAPIFITIIIGAFIILLILINGGGTNNETNSRGKLISVLKEYSFVCSDDLCTNTQRQNDCELTGSVEFSKFQFTNKMYCSLNNITITTTYNWKADNLIQYFDMQDYNDMAVLDEKGEYSCNARTANCYDMKTTMLQHKNQFLNFVSEAGLDIVDLK